MAGETDLGEMLATLEVVRRPGVFTYITSETVGVGQAAAMIREDEGTTLVVSTEVATEHGYAIEFEAAWLTLVVHSSLEAVGLTAAFSAAFGARGIACNVLAGHVHDHILVPLDLADEAVAALVLLRQPDTDVGRG